MAATVTGPTATGWTVADLAERFGTMPFASVCRGPAAEVGVVALAEWAGA